MHGFRTDLVRKLRGICDVAKQHRDLFDLTFKCESRFECLPLQMGWRVRPGTGLQRFAALIAKLAIRRAVMAALWTFDQQSLTASATVMSISAILMLA